MKFESQVQGKILILKMEGDLIGENSGAELVELVTDNISQGTTQGIVNIEKLRYINSSGIGVLITLLTKFRNKDGELVLVNPSENVKKLLIITKLNAIFTIVDSEDEALKILR